MHVVIFTGGEYTKSENARNFFECLNKPDFVIAADSGLEAAMEYGFTPDIILGDMDSLKDADSILKNFPAEKIIKHNPYKDFSDTELALDYAYEKIAGSVLDLDSYSDSAQNTTRDFFVTLIGGAGGRIDHLLGIFDLFSEEKRPSAWLYNNQVLWFAGQGSGFEISNLKQNDYISVARPSGSRAGGKINSSGLEWESEHFRKEGMPSLSNRISDKAFAADMVDKTAFAADMADKKVSIKVEEGNFILILPVTAKVRFV